MVSITIAMKLLSTLSICQCLRIVVISPEYLGGQKRGAVNYFVCWKSAQSWASCLVCIETEATTTFANSGAQLPITAEQPPPPPPLLCDSLKLRLLPLITKLLVLLAQIQKQKRLGAKFWPQLAQRVDRYWFGCLQERGADPNFKEKTNLKIQEFVSLQTLGLLLARPVNHTLESIRPRPVLFEPYKSKFPEKKNAFHQSNKQGRFTLTNLWACWESFPPRGRVRNASECFSAPTKGNFEIDLSRFGLLFTSLPSLPTVNCVQFNISRRLMSIICSARERVKNAHAQTPTYWQTSRREGGKKSPLSL